MQEVNINDISIWSAIKFGYFASFGAFLFVFMTFFCDKILDKVI